MAFSVLSICFNWNAGSRKRKAWKTPCISSGSITAAALMYLTKIATSLIGGQYFSKILDLPTFFFLFAVVISACRKMDLNGKFYVRLRNWSETIYFVHMYFVALCALVLYKSDYHNFKTCAKCCA